MKHARMKTSLMEKSGVLMDGVMQRLSSVDTVDRVVEGSVDESCKARWIFGPTDASRLNLSGGSTTDLLIPISFEVDELFAGCNGAWV